MTPLPLVIINRMGVREGKQKVISLESSQTVGVTTSLSTKRVRQRERDLSSTGDKYSVGFRKVVDVSPKEGRGPLN